MNDYLKIKKYLEYNFNSFKDEVIKEFVNYYGEQYKDIIISRINNTNFIFYINPNYNEFFIYNNNKNKKLKKKYDKIQHIIKTKSLNNGQIFNSKNLSSIAYLSVLNNNGSCFIYMYSNSEKSLKKEIFIPVFYADDCAIIHEMIHSIMSTPLILEGQNNQKSLIYKFGICTSENEGEVLLEECITELEAKIIYNRIKNKNISLIDNYYFLNNCNCFYDSFIPYISKFYYLFRKDINDSRITLNNRKFINDIGNNNYNKFIMFLKDFYDNMYDCDKSFYKLFIDESINEMNKEKKLELNK